MASCCLSYLGSFSQKLSYLVHFGTSLLALVLLCCYNLCSQSLEYTPAVSLPSPMVSAVWSSFYAQESQQLQKWPFGSADVELILAAAGHNLWPSQEM